VGTLFFINDSKLPAPEIVLLPNSRLKQKVQISSIHITVNQYLALCQSGKGANDAGLASASLTA
jgi:hypothetical protein